ncbi:glycosyltransferase family 39 protein [Actinoplanes sp. NPDC049118]|uniref:glycosyltransferase family 39 protein n=1 Tax=Actinoplanes sp. NPDC049118 TaxID=3155769 RepID=UPI0033EBF181
MTDAQVLSPPSPHIVAQRRGTVHQAEPGARRWSMTSTVLLVLPPALLALTMSVAGIGSRSMWNDEYATWYASTLGFRDLAKLLNNVDAVVAPYYLVLHVWIDVFGDTEASLRMPSALAMAATAALTASLGRRLFDTGTGLAAGLIMAALPTATRYGQEARPYAFAIGLATLATLLLLRAMERPTWRRWYWYSGGVILAGLVHIVTLTVLLAHAVFMWRAFRVSGDLRLLRWIAGAFLAVTAALPLAAKGSDQSSVISWIRADATAVMTLPERIFGSWQVALVVLGAALLATVLLWSTQRGPIVLLLSWALFPPVFCYVTFPLLHLFLHRYLLFTVPAWALLAAALGFTLVRFLGRRRARIPVSLSALLVVAAVLLVGGPGQRAARHSPVYGEPDFRGAAAAVLAAAAPGDGIVYSGVTRNGRRAFDYEGRKTAVPRDVLVERTSQQNGTFGAQECADPGLCVGATRRIWLVSPTEAHLNPMSGMPGHIQGFLLTAYTVSEFRTFEHVRIFVLNRKDVR